MTIHSVEGACHEPPLILLADDDRLTRTILCEALQKEGYRVAEVSDGQACLEAYKAVRPNLVLLDAMMPVMNGFDCCTRLLTLPGSHHTPILMITGLDDQTSVDWAFQVGATDYVTKPIHWSVLRQRVRILIEKSQLYQELEQAYDKLKLVASVDSLTQVYNRRVFDEYLDSQWQNLLNEQSPLSLILGDIDEFKAYNDTYGHQAGDYCLHKVASALKQSIKYPTDLVARYGGEEFAVVLPKTSAAGAVHVAETIQTQVAALNLAHVGSCTKKHVTISLGVASTIPSNESSAAALVRAADKALYQAKAQGGNCVIFKN
ncbi:PleD family two-component system response regulator [Leptolyngbya sp. FACHB-16]|uniref:response regulator n=1 Tax=unclassified Leptolyngbya TaxID=2650499 RepID=UPI001685AEA7|nr:PleD family two-component system response regulator [Leptolyngbya sp. FACHB-16]MBD2153416.1 PleD family two-component system response regulator [Leptolyngbya sp. FACHB-16]